MSVDMNDDFIAYNNNQGSLVKAWVKGVPIEDDAIEQAMKTAALPFVFKHVALMPDAHVGIGATVGTVIATRGAVVPAAVGVDIGCGMIAAQTMLTVEQLPDNLNRLRLSIEAAVPVGFAKHNKPTAESDRACKAFEKLSQPLKDLLDKIDYQTDNGALSQNLKSTIENLYAVFSRYPERPDMPTCGAFCVN
jgi:tRNA-splicing ligase RtcB